MIMLKIYFNGELLLVNYSYSITLQMIELRDTPAIYIICTYSQKSEQVVKEVI